MLKKEARKFFQQKRDELSAASKAKLDDLLLIQFQKIQLPFLSLVCSYYPLDEKGEMNTFIITDYLRFRNPGLSIAYPKIDISSNTMQVIVCDEDDEFEKNAYNIPEPISCETVAPSSIEMVLVPLLAFDKKGYRVGYGKGFYDVFLKQCSDDCIKIGFSYFDPVDVIDDAAHFDVPLNLCITPQQAYVF